MNMNKIAYTLMLFCLSGSPVMATAQQTAATKIQKTDISFLSGGLLVKAWFITPADTPAKKLPCIVMGPGFSGTKECNYQFFAYHFAEEGYAVLLFDYPNFGESAGSIRGEADPWQQIQCYRDGISWAAAHPLIDANRIGVWGGSYSGGHVLVVSATDPRVKCVVAMTPFISGSYYVKKLPPDTKNFMYQQFQRDRLTRIQGGEPAKIPVATKEGKQFSAIFSPHAWTFIQSFSEYAPRYENLVTLKSLEMQLEYEPGHYVQDMGTKPKLFIIAKNDELIPEQLIMETYQKAPEPKKVAYLEGHHFSPYMSKLDEAAHLAIEWFKANL